MSLTHPGFSRTVLAQVCRSAVLLTGIMILGNAAAFAQGLIYHLPPDGTAIRYEGDLVQTEIRPDLAEGAETLTFRREITIKSVGQVDAEFEGVMQPCRWIEIKVVTGEQTETGIEPGPGGERIYKVLVPESKVVATEVDSDTIPVSMLPIVKGWRRTGEGSVVPIKSSSLRVYPTISLITNYADPEVVASGVDPMVPVGNYTAEHRRGLFVMERPESQSTNEGEYWVSADIPFGLAKWNVKVTRRTKDLTSPRDAFAETSNVTVAMKAVRIDQNAVSELVTPE